jgi:serine phosphatase RsbU (regulator of sigma subunit)/tetratricopeptide (TPR) repeat protein
LTEITLEALSEDESRQLVANLLAIEALPEYLRALILQKSEGNPFFVEEVVRMLIERQAIVKERSGWVAGSNIDHLDIPDNLQGLLMARIDHLSEQGKNTLKVAAVVGRQFPVRVLQQVLYFTNSPSQPALNKTIGTLSNLESTGLIQVAQVQPELQYYFRHSLVQEAAYASLLVSDRKRLHQVVGETVEQMYPDQLSSCELAPRLAQHFFEAGDDQRALKYFSTAGESALNCFANQEAENHFRRGVSLSGSKETSATLLVGLGESLARQSRYAEAIATWREAINLYVSMNDLDRVALIFARSARAAWWNGDTPLCLKLCQEGLQVVAGAPQSSEQAYLIHETARAYYFNGVPSPAKQLCLQALEMAESFGNIEVQADALTTLGILPDQSLEETVDALNQAIALAESAGLLITASRAHINMGSMVKGFFGDLERARYHYQRALDIARIRGVVQEELFALETLASISLETGDIETVEEMLLLVERLIDELSDKASAITEYNVIKAIITLWQGQWEEALELMRINSSAARESGDLQNLLNTDLNMVMAMLEMSEFDLAVDWREAEAALAEALELCDRGLGDRITPLCYFALLRLKQGKIAEAENYFSQTSTGTNTRSIIWIEILLNWTKAEIAAAKKNWPESNHLYEIAYKIVNRLEQRWFKGRIALGWAEMLISQGDLAGLERARDLLKDSSTAFMMMRGSGYLERIDKRVRQLHERSLTQAAMQNEVVQEMAQARRIQKSFLPQSPPQIAGWDLAAALEPARETSGDYYDFIPLPGKRLGIVIADVADKGAGAALYMASSRTLIRTYASDFLDHPAQVLASANQRLILDTHSGLFVTLFYGILDPASGHLVYCNAGHNPPILFSPTRHQFAETLASTGIPLGVMEDATWEEVNKSLAPGEVLTLFTDGVTEAQNKSGEFFGEARIHACIQERLTSTKNDETISQTILDGLLEQIHQFVGAAHPSDDITLIVIHRAL